MEVIIPNRNTPREKKNFRPNLKPENYEKTYIKNTLIITLISISQRWQGVGCVIVRTLRSTGL